MKKYKISRYDHIDIEEIEVVSETEHFVTIRRIDYNKKPYDRKEKKDGSIYNTWEEARHALVMRANDSLEACENKITIVKENLRMLDDMVPPHA